jgi:hypothetical protein
MRRHHDIDAHLCTSTDRFVEIINLEPQQDTVSIGAVVRLTDVTVIVLDLKAVQLHHKPISLNQAFVVGAAVVATDAEQLLVPTAACLNVSGTDERLRVHAPTLFHLELANTD